MWLACNPITRGIYAGLLRVPGQMNYVFKIVSKTKNEDMKTGPLSITQGPGTLRPVWLPPPPHVPGEGRSLHAYIRYSCCLKVQYMGLWPQALFWGWGKDKHLPQSSRAKSDTYHQSGPKTPGV